MTLSISLRVEQFQTWINTVAYLAVLSRTMCSPKLSYSRPVVVLLHHSFRSIVSVSESDVYMMSTLFAPQLVYMTKHKLSNSDSTNFDRSDVPGVLLGSLTSVAASVSASVSCDVRTVASGAEAVPSA